MLTRFRIWLANLIWHSPDRSYAKDYEVLVRLARRCAYDLSHCVDYIPDDHYAIVDFGMRKRADWWVALFAKGNPGKDYRIEGDIKLHNTEHDLDRIMQWLCEVRPILDKAKIELPPEPDIHWLPF